MITRFGSLYAGAVDLEDYGYEATPVNDRWLSDEHLATVFEKSEAIAEADGPDRLLDALVRRAPLPARRVRVHPERPDAGRPPGPPDEEPELRLRLQHRADVAPGPPRRGLRDRRHPDQGAGDLRRRARLPHPRGRGVRRADAGPGRQPRAVRGAGRDRPQGAQPALVLAPGQALHRPAPSAVSRLRGRGDHPGAAPDVPRGRVLPADRQRLRARPRLHGEDGHEGDHGRRRGDRRRQRAGRARLAADAGHATAARPSLAATSSWA